MKLKLTKSLVYAVIRAVMYIFFGVNIGDCQEQCNNEEVNYDEASQVVKE